MCIVGVSEKMPLWLLGIPVVLQSKRDWRMVQLYIHNGSACDIGGEHKVEEIGLRLNCMRYIRLL